ncbi:adenylate kinase [Mucilaginibacter sp. FT3.2]|uniref:adenylate kinase n=1 Tax=Mucilaginibacter sp. FT3.2 TaxID=2723090 RepID=UPI00160EA428|nr:adenylate kinase [Mucilaginibacter sp. FT3.2]MBB6232020.1 adenylate kinase family enzyme [Mucilaginibacter sp. FT3.2]
MHINIFGASSSGVTTLGNTLAKKLKYPYFDSDKYFWLPTDPPFTDRRPANERNTLINQHTAVHTNWILGGSVINWNNNWNFDLSVFLYLPREIRIDRLKKREIERYGNIIYTDAERNKQHLAFIEWASGYDDNITNGRNLHAHQNWMQGLKKPLLVIEGDTTVEERLEAILRKLEELR